VTEPQRYFLLVQSGDELLDWREAVTFYAGAWQSVQGGGDHAFQHFEKEIAPILRFSRSANR
jgi:Predicted esterase